MVSFIILTWNSKDYIESCIKSVLEIPIEKELIIIDNGSSDSTSDILRRYSKEIKLIELDRNYGTTYPRNIGLREISSNSKYVCILDSDTIVVGDTIQKLTNVLDTNESIGLVSPFLYYPDGIRQLSYKKFPTVQLKIFKAIPVMMLNKYAEKLERIDLDEGNNYNYIDYAISACWLIKRDVLEKVGLLDENIFYAPEDVDFCLRVWQCGYKVAIVSDTFVTHFTQRISKKKLVSKINLEHVKGLLYYFNKHKYYFSRRKLYKRYQTTKL